MRNVRLPAAVIALADELVGGSHAELEALYLDAGAPPPAPDGPHGARWKSWLKKASRDPNVDSLAVLGGVIEEFMDLPPREGGASFADWEVGRARMLAVLEEFGLQYFRGGRVLPVGAIPPTGVPQDQTLRLADEAMPANIDALLSVVVKGVPRAMAPLVHRRRGVPELQFDVEADLQDILHSLLRPWVADIRAEEFTPSHAGASTRMDFLLPDHKTVIEVKRVRDAAHGRRVGQELIIDIEHYRRHPDCERLVCAVYDIGHHLANPAGLAADLEGVRSVGDGKIEVRVLVVAP